MTQRSSPPPKKENHISQWVVGAGAVGGAIGAILQGLAAQGIKDVFEHPARLVLAFVGLGLASSVVAWFVIRARNKKKILPVTDVGVELRDAARRLVTELHKRWFSQGRALDPGFRVSLFMPRREAENIVWICAARTISPAEDAAEWPHVDDRQERTKAGIVNYAVTEGAGLEVPGVPLSTRTDAAVVTRYLKESCLTDELHAKRSWKWASLTLRLARARKGGILCVIVVEREDGEPIRHARALHIAEDAPEPIRHDICGWEQQLAADVWAAIRDDQ